MKNYPLWKIFVVFILLSLGIIFAIPSLLYKQDTGSWYLDNRLNLGLDLRGGAHLLAEVQVDDVYKARMKAIWPELRDILREERATIGTIRLQDGPADRLTVKISEPDGMARAVERAGELAKPIA